MAITNFMITLVGVATVAYLMRGDVRTGATTFRRNLKHIRGWLEEQGAASSQATKEEVKQVTDKVKPPPQNPTKTPEP
ncbi:g12273 [Coccomyxa viridis]|uniref:G12273 protein n=1 Tax=Coccomyxa viridis TaxID=1274662 RepID=A0ABP1G9Y0_9CHLO